MLSDLERRIKALSGEENDDDEEGYSEESSEEVLGPNGFTQAEEEELLSQGVKPWDEDAHNFLNALRGDFYF
jgi:hypothetical protein